MADQKIGWIGTGVMGHSMCEHILKAGYEVAVNNRTRQRAVELEKSGAIWCDEPAEVAARSQIIFSIVGYPSDVEQVFLGNEGLIANASTGSLLVDMTTSQPSLAKRIYSSAKEKGCSALDAPVSGGDVGARGGSLAIMVGGEEADFNRAEPFFQIMGENISLMGPPGSGQHTKMSNQILIASTMIGVVESLLYGRRAGLSQDSIIDVIGKGAAASWSINNLGRRIVQGDFAPGFYIKHFVKDMGIALAEAKTMKLSLPGLALAHQFYMAAIAEGLENLGTQGLYKVLDRINSAKE